MEHILIKNYEELATTDTRKLALAVAEKGLQAINTENAVNASITLIEDRLVIQGSEFNLSEYKNIKVVGFGKSSVAAAQSLEKILGPKISAGAVVGLQKENLRYVETFAGTHPKPSLANTEAGEIIFELVKNSSVSDLIIVLVSGGGSALLCYGKEELEQGARLYDGFLGAGKTISEMNTVRKHISLLKGGGLAKLAYPATVIGLIFSDVPGNNFEDVASGPTYKDLTTIEDARKIIKDINLGEFHLLETPKEDKYFEKVHNFVMVSNKTAVEAMKKYGEEALGLKTEVVSTELYDSAEIVVQKIADKKRGTELVLGAGEPRVKVGPGGGKGGRNLHLSLLALKYKLEEEGGVFLSLASDGLDNSDMAGAIADKETARKALSFNLKLEDYLGKFNSYNFFKQTGDLIETGATGANVSDLMIFIKK